MGIEILTKNMTAGDTVNFVFQGNVKQCFLGINYFELWNSQGEDTAPITRISIFAEPLSLSGNALPVKLSMFPSTGKPGNSRGKVTVLALTDTDDEEFRMVTSLKNGQTISLPGNPDILIPAMSGFDVSFNDGKGHHIHSFGIDTAAVKQMGDVAMMSSKTKLDDTSGHYCHPQAYAFGSILAYTGQSERIRCTSYILTDKQRSYDLPNLAAKFGVFVSSFELNYAPGIDRPIWTLSFSANAGYDTRLKKTFVGASGMLNSYIKVPDTFFKATVSLVEILEEQLTTERSAMEMIEREDAQ